MCASRILQIESGEHSGVTASRTPSGRNNAQRGRSTSASNNTPPVAGAQSGPELRTHNIIEPQTFVHPDFRASQDEVASLHLDFRALQDEVVIDPPPSYQEVMSGSYIQMIPWNCLLSSLLIFNHNLQLIGSWYDIFGHHDTSTNKQVEQYIILVEYTSQSINMYFSKLIWLFLLLYLMH